ncbi:hypothetical protein GGD55_006146 [Rhizobium giardinii]|uniref:Uncharacterized protein n=1 Tax=Rhizobium giardinii TaxID=56731 RepID=A0A7W8UHD5_9HYPH|nr:hypothetical protein [Rhizobium giardinii]
MGWGASGRSHLNNGLAHSYLAEKAELGKERAIALYKALDDRSIRSKLRTDCSFRRAGKLKLASKTPAHPGARSRNFEAVQAEVDPTRRCLAQAT